ncbi:hypothetical protein [Spirosoma fluviale]|uniref:ApeA N-terminal domain-containing protein n=1 Tax=Spirosoma fluviale TaxID=1597977 RepID=A0A286G3S6_9BACT|nr:hypothetical protein [Spirosoma fluviale]SOD90153.1 hypothetical protein SAMN06269250_3316 [Spirosoma fluviale]
MDNKYRLRISDSSFGVGETGYIRNPQHKYLRFNGKRISGIVTNIGYALIKHYFKSINKSINNWRKDNKVYRISYEDGNGKEVVSNSFNYLIITQGLRENGAFVPEDYNLPRYECLWLDVSLNIRMESLLNVRDSTPQQQYGENFPIKPSLDREGYIITSFNPQLINRVISKRRYLVNTSNEIFEFEWLYDFKNLINDIISLLDITLLQVYTKAEFDPLPSWKFNKAKLGVKNGRRLNDKLKWVYSITGNSINIEPEMASLESLRELRNHLNHFDPPTFAFTVEEASEWLNHVLNVAVILLKIRQALDVSISSSLISLLLQEYIEFVPEDAFKDRQPLDKNTSGYKTSVWP